MTVSHQTLAPSVEASHNSEIAWGGCHAFRLDFSPLEGISANFEGKKERGGAGSNRPPFCHKDNTPRVSYRLSYGDRSSTDVRKMCL